MPLSGMSKENPENQMVKPSNGIDKACGDMRELKVQMKSTASQTKLSMANEDIEVPLSDKNENSGIIAVLGEGGEVKDILMPEEFRTVFVDKPSETSSEDKIIEKFRRYGKIKNYRIFRSSQKRWGCVTFKSATDAALAVQATKEDESEVARPERRGRSYQNSDFRVKVTWCRRESKGFGFVDVAPKDLKKIMKFGVINIEGHLVKLVLERKAEKSLYLRNFGKDVNECDIKNAFLKLVGNVNFERITVVREKVDLDKEDIEAIGKELMERIKESVPKDHFHLDMKHPRNPGTVMHLAFANFTNIDEGIATCRRMSGRTYIQNQVVTMEPQIKSSVLISPEVHEAVQDELESCLKEYQDLGISEVEIARASLENGSVNLNIESSNIMELAKVRARLEDILQADVLESGTYQHVHHLFTTSGQDFLKEVESKFKAYIHADNRNLTISIQGKQVSRTMARSAINEFLSSIVNSEWKEVNLRSNAMPNGLMKTLMNAYGLDLEKLQQKTGLKSLTLNFKQQIVKMIGSTENIDWTVAVIDEVCASLQDGPKKDTEEKDLPDCCVCFCPIEEKDLYRLEFCGHAYCNICAKLQIEYHLKTKEMPISCLQQDCGKPFMWLDLTFFAKQGSFTMNSITQLSVSSFVIANSKNIKYCLTPDCNMVYKVTTTGAVFRCPECNIKICTSCHTQYHEGLTCTMLRRAREDNFDVYLASSKDTKKCPNCSTAIEKVGGCNHMMCEVCECHFCWICLKRFKTSKACFSHLSAKHGGRV